MSVALQDQQVDVSALGTSAWLAYLQTRSGKLTHDDIAEGARRIDLARETCARDTLIAISDGLQSLLSEMRGWLRGLKQKGAVMALQVTASEAARLCPPALHRSENTILSRVDTDGSVEVSWLGAAHSYLVGADSFIDNLVEMGLLVTETCGSEMRYVLGPRARAALNRFAAEHAARQRRSSGKPA